MNTRTVLLWHNNGVERIYFTVNPAEITVTRPNTNRVCTLAMGGSANIWGGRGLREVRLTTFLPDENSPFFTGTSPQTVLTRLRSWQDSGDPVRLIVSDSDINDAFLIEDVSETLREGDADVGISVTLREYKFKSTLAGGGASTATKTTTARTDERTAPKTYTVKRGDTLWGIACRLYGDGTKWGTLAAKNGISNPHSLQIGTVLTV
ncbi:MAG: LysM peptidoglycan-binding domain-containing protein [Oscillibacter sp.]|jgi:LysM repeat protein|nr:LysM peptidoglycan-binding domain-containing protein [Oscillibacter sp.]